MSFAYNGSHFETAQKQGSRSSFKKIENNCVQNPEHLWYEIKKPVLFTSSLSGALFKEGM